MKIAVVDIETTGFSHDNDCIVEIGIVELCLETGQKNVLYDEIIKEKHLEDYHKRSWIFENSDLSHEDVLMRGKAFGREKGKIQNILQCYRVTAYNKKFDFSFLKSRGILFDELQCPMIAATSVCCIPNKNGRGHKWPKVPEAHYHFFGDEDYIEKHRALSDAMDEADIVYELYKLGEFSSERDGKAQKW
ncbi:MAG: exonuclease domain-containing protein [Nanoarchaeota archaeon]|nr:exonuclease domain-containing protein [Nanoarchaeota archaeon]